MITRRKVYRVVWIDPYGDCIDYDHADDALPVAKRAAYADTQARNWASVPGAVAGIVESGIDTWDSEAESRVDLDMQTVAVYGDASAARAGGWLEESQA